MTTPPSEDERAAPETSAADVTIIIPCRPEYVAVARLAILGVANRLDFSYDEVEDVRLAVGEACSHAIERLGSTSPADEPKIRIDSHISVDGLSIVVQDNVQATGIADAGDASDVAPEDNLDEIDLDRQDLGALLMEILVDSVTVEQAESGTTVKLYKAAAERSAQTAE